MTLQEMIETKLTDLGLWPDQAHAVVEELKAAPAQEPMKGRWGHPATDYPSFMVAVLMVAARRQAVDWIDKNKPQHFARGILVQ